MAFEFAMSFEVMLYALSKDIANSKATNHVSEGSVFLLACSSKGDRTLNCLSQAARSV